MILVRPFTEADDVAGFHAAKGILTSEGGKASHAALVARGMGRPAVVGAGELTIDLKAKEIRVGDTTVGEGDRIAIDGTKGCVTLEDVPLVEAETSEYFDTVLEWSDEIRRLGVRANADTPEDATQGARAGRRGHRPVPHRAHVHGRGPPAQDAGDDHGRRRGLPARGARGAAAAPAGGLRGALRGDGGAAGDDPAARPAAARVPQEPARTCARRSSARGSSAPTTSSSSRRRSRAWRRSTRRTRCSAPAAAGWGS